MSIDPHHIRMAEALLFAASEPLDEATRQQRWEERLICSYSVDTGRCACYSPQGEKAELTAERCQELAERGSVLQQ